MKILLLGEYSNVHATLAEGLRALGHEVTVASDGDGWKNYPRDIDLRRRSLSMWSTACYYLRLQVNFKQFKGYDVVQIINPVFLPLKAERMWKFYRYLRAHNKKVFMGAFGMDYYYIKACLDKTTFRYSDFNFGKLERDYPDARAFKRDWLTGEKGRLNQYIAKDCDGIIAGLYEYYAAYHPVFGDKVQFIPFPLRPKTVSIHRCNDEPVRFFIGIQRGRSLYKGTDIMYDALQRVQRDYPQQCEIRKAESVPFEEYVRLFNGADVLLDQLYSYTPAMNALEAMSNGLIVVGGAEPENYEVLGDRDLFPIINVFPSEQDVYEKLRDLVLHPERIARLRQDSVTYINRYHDHKKVAAAYVRFWEKP